MTAISRNDSKRDDAKKLGADEFIATGKDIKQGIKGHGHSLDLIICTISSSFPGLMLCLGC